MTTKERPILFSAPMVRALLDGSKTQTRRLVKPQPDIVFAGPIPGAGICGKYTHDDEKHGRLGVHIPCPYGQPGDRLWVRENFAHIYRDNSLPERRSFEDVAYMANGHSIDIGAYGSWKPSIHMPRWASRITLEISSVRVERLQDITRGDAMAEGCPFPNMAQGNDPRQWYEQLWGEINGPDSWATNPWVWAIEFKRINQAAA